MPLQALLAVVVAVAPAATFGCWHDCSDAACPFGADDSFDVRLGLSGTARPKRLRFEVLNLAARVTTHAGKLLMLVGRVAAEAAQLVTARVRLLALLPATVG